MLLQHRTSRAMARHCGDSDVSSSSAYDGTALVQGSLQRQAENDNATVASLAKSLPAAISQVEREAANQATLLRSWLAARLDPRPTQVGEDSIGVYPSDDWVAPMGMRVSRFAPRVSRQDASLDA